MEIIARQELDPRLSKSCIEDVDTERFKQKSLSSEFDQPWPDLNSDLEKCLAEEYSNGE